MNNRKIESNKQETIQIMDKPPRMGGKISTIPIKDFEQKIGQPYVERIDAESATHLSALSNNIEGNLTSAQLIRQLENILSTPQNKLALCKINDTVGYGVFAAQDIPKDTVLCFYSGVLKNSQKVRDHHDEALGYYGSNMSFSTKNYRGIASFFQHLPTALKFPNAKIFSQLLQSMGQSVSENELKINDELYSVEFFDSNIGKSVATENIRKEYVLYKGIPVVLLVTNNAIKSGDQLGFNYGKDYWLSRERVPEFFDKTGAIIPASSYRRTFYSLKIVGSSSTVELSPLVQQIRNGKSTIEITDEKNRTKSVEAAIVLNELLRVRGISQDEYQTLQRKLTTPLSGHSLFPTTKVDYLVKKYKLTDSTQASLEKGLRMAATNNQTEDLKHFIQYVKNINAVDSNPATHRTALHWAAIKGHDECYQLLLDAGANPEIEDATKTTPALYFGRQQTLSNEL